MPLQPQGDRPGCQQTAHGTFGVGQAGCVRKVKAARARVLVLHCRGKSGKVRRPQASRMMASACALN